MRLQYGTETSEPENEIGSSPRNGDKGESGNEAKEERVRLWIWE